jgi:hypothetical protein
MGDGVQTKEKGGLGVVNLDIQKDALLMKHLYKKKLTIMMRLGWTWFGRLITRVQFHMPYMTGQVVLVEGYMQVVYKIHRCVDVFSKPCRRTACVI